MSAPHRLLVVTGRPRSAGRLDWPGSTELPDPPVERLEALLSEGGFHWVGGGEPTLRADLPRLIAAGGSSVGLDCDGLALAGAGVARGLHAAGLRRVRIALHSGRSEAHDWLVGLSGAARRARQAMERCADAGLDVHASITVTRPGMDLLPETAALAGRLGASTIRMRRLRRRGPATAAYITLSPRLGLLEPYLEAAAHRARELGATVRLEGFPRCAASRLPSEFFLRGREELVVPPVRELGQLAEDLTEAPAAPGCEDCPGSPLCPGAPADYVERFGRLEIDSSGIRPQAPVEPASSGESPPPPPPPRRGRPPATRLRHPRRQAGARDLGGDPLAGQTLTPPRELLSVELEGTRRAIRQRMVRLAQEGADALRIVGGFDHPHAGELLRDALRLSLPRVELAGDLSPLDALKDGQVMGLRGLHRVYPAQLQSGEAAATQARFVDRLQRLAGVPASPPDAAKDDHAR